MISSIENDWFYNLKMETVRDVLYFCKDFSFYDHNSIANFDKINQLRKCIFNSFNEIIPIDGLLKVLGIIEDMTLMMFADDITNKFDEIHKLREKISYFLSLEKVFKAEEAANKTFS